MVSVSGRASEKPSEEKDWNTLDPDIGNHDFTHSTSPS